jgi:hypothetical protein
VLMIDDIFSKKVKHKKGAFTTAKRLFHPVFLQYLKLFFKGSMIKQYDLFFYQS